MSSIWTTSDGAWRLLAPSGFPDEATLHSLVEEAPELLPLAGEPRLVVLGREVPIGGGYADLVAIEPTGRFVVIEVKLASNAESRRAVIAQILGYAAALRGTSLEQLQNAVLRSSLSKRGYASIATAVEEADQEGSFELAEFEAGAAESLRSGRFRLVLVLDDAPTELIRIVGYLESIAPQLVIDLVTVAAYDVGGQRVLVPQRVEPGDLARPAPSAVSSAAGTTANTNQGHLIDPREFEEGIGDAAENAQPLLLRMFAWAKELEEEGVIRLLAFRGASGVTTLLPYLTNDDAGLMTVWTDGSISLWRSVFERHAPDAISAVEALIAPAELGRGRVIKSVSDELLAVLADAYRRASTPLT